MNPKIEQLLESLGLFKDRRRDNEYCLDDHDMQMLIQKITETLSNRLDLEHVEAAGEWDDGPICFTSGIETAQTIIKNYFKEDNERCQNLIN